MGVIEYTRQLQEQLGDAHEELPGTLLFDYPTARGLHRYFAEAAVDIHNERPADDELLSAGMDAAGGEFPRVLVTARVGHLPSSCHASTSDTRDQHYELLSTATVLTSVANRAWWHGLADQLPAELAAAKYGGFLHSVQCFDSSAFRISLAEAVGMDPQQRRLLEVGYDALHASGRSRNSLDGTQLGVFVGVCNFDYARLVSMENGFGGTGVAACVASGRVSFCLGLLGPVASYDTSCSSSLVGCHAALRAVQLRECSDALACGTNMLLSPDVSVLFAMAGMTSPHGNCHTFDKRANGYTRSENCVTCVLEPQYVEDNDDSVGAWPTLHGISVRSDGRSSSLTAPSGRAQQALHRAALAVSSIRAEQLSCTEAHGTGTSLGDPVEMSALSPSLRASHSEAVCRKAAVSSLKGNVGHAEGGAGLGGLLMSLRKAQSAEGPPNPHLRILNPLLLSSLAAAETTASVGTQLCALHQNDGQVSGTTSSFGYGGTIATAITSDGGAPTSTLTAMCCCSSVLPPFHGVAGWRRRVIWPEDLPLVAKAHTGAYNTVWRVQGDVATPSPAPRTVVLMDAALSPKGTARAEEPRMGTLHLGSCCHVVLALGVGSDARPTLTCLAAVASCLDQAGSLVASITLLTSGTQLPTSRVCASSTSCGGVQAMVRVVRLERADLSLCQVDMDGAPACTAQSVKAATCGEQAPLETEVAYAAMKGGAART